MAEAFGTTETQGALIQEVVENMPADVAGLRRGDIIVRFNNMRVRNANDLRLAVGQTPPGSETSVEIIRRGERMTLTVNLSDSDDAAVANSAGEWVTGVDIANLDADTREAHNIPANVNGVIVTQVASNSPHARVLRPGMVIIEINDRPATDVREARQLLRRGANKLYVFQRGSFGYLAIRVN
ncbi:MAG: PDZ domain-containing protein [Verrucomicrobia bacterium]|nr:PDZ domain-containing protein [Verrucomicrobiota bacterium]